MVPVASSPAGHALPPARTSASKRSPRSRASARRCRRCWLVPALAGSRWPSNTSCGAGRGAGRRGQQEGCCRRKRRRSASAPAGRRRAHHGRHACLLQRGHHFEAEGDVRWVIAALLPGPPALHELHRAAHGAPAGSGGRRQAAVRQGRPGRSGRRWAALLECSDRGSSPRARRGGSSCRQLPQLDSRLRSAGGLPGPPPHRPGRAAHLCSHPEASTATRCPERRRTCWCSTWLLSTECKPEMPMVECVGAQRGPPHRPSATHSAPQHASGHTSHFSSPRLGQRIYRAAQQVQV